MGSQSLQRRRNPGTFKVLVISVAVFLFCLTYWLIASISFDRNCGGILKRAADASTIEIAIEQLEIAVRYMEEEELTEGFTSVVYRTPDEDVGFWYNNIAGALKELQEFNPKTDLRDPTIMLVKLRETLLDDTDEGIVVTVPEGILVFPHNTLFAFMELISLICLVFSAFIVFIG